MNDEGKGGLYERYDELCKTAVRAEALRWEIVRTFPPLPDGYQWGFDPALSSFDVDDRQGFICATFYRNPDDPDEWISSVVCGRRSISLSPVSSLERAAKLVVDTVHRCERFRAQNARKESADE